MLRCKRNNKGFTLIEMIIAMSIFTIIIGVGYKVINGSNQANAAQLEISKEQQNANLVNKYFTKDIEIAQSFQGIGIDNDGNIINNKSTDIKYEYNINVNNNGTTKIIKYEVDVNQLAKEYSINRKEDDTMINLIADQKYNSLNPEMPFVVSKEEDLYYINLIIGDNKYDFEVNSRIKLENTDTITPPGGGGDLNAIGNIVIDKTVNSVDVTINDTVSKNEYNPRIAVKKYDNQRKVNLYLDHAKSEYNFEFEEGYLKISSNNNYIDFDVDDTKELDNNEFRVSFESRKRDVKIYKNNEEIIYIDTNGNDELELSLFDDTSHEVDIDIEGDEVELDFGDGDFKNKSTYNNSNKEIEVELAKYLVEDVKLIDIKTINSEVNLEGDGSGYLTEILGLKPNNYSDDDEIDLEMDTNGMVEGSSVIINFNKEEDQEEISMCGIEFEGRKIHGSDEIVVSAISCEHSNNKEEILTIPTKQFNKGVMDMNFVTNEINITGHKLENYSIELDLHFRPEKVFANGREIDVDSNGKVTIDDIHVNPGSGKEFYKVQW